MKTVKILAIILSTIALIKSNCDNGCLRCGPLEKCLFCDFQSGYFLAEGKCTKSVFTNCIDFNLTGDCSKCNEGYYPDNNTKTCVKIETVLENCKFYDSPSVCSLCKEEHFVLNGKCLKIETPINQCIYYFNQSVCLECNTSYELQSDFKSCKKSPESRNCSIYTNFKCDSCEEGYVPNKNYYLDVLFSFKISDSKSVLNFLKHSKLGRGDALAPSKCQENKNENCLESENANLCKVCNKGFYLNAEKKCISNPEQQILNCQIYNSKTDCGKCIENFYLETSQSCKPIINIENCISYHLSLESTCLECVGTHFLQGNLCNLRTKIIENCVVYHHNQDLCKECSVDFHLTNDSLKCLNKIPNCTIYANSSVTDTALTCNGCGSLNYLKATDNACLGGNVQNCDLYGNTEVLCSKCLNEFYLDAGVCQKHDPITSCIGYDFIIKNKCTQCMQNHILFENKNGCKPVIPILNCTSYSDSNTCQSCEDGFVLNTNSCVAIDSSENCLQKNTINGCIKCRVGYFITGLVCKLYKNYQKENCVSIANDGSNQNGLSCEKCKPYYFPYNYEDSYVCTLNQRLIDDSIKINNCIKHKTNSGVTICEECVENYFRNSSGQCELCSTGLKFEYQYVLSSVSFNTQTASSIRKNQCLTVDPLCSVKSMSVFGEGICLTCNSTKVPLYSYQKTLVNPSIAYGTTEKSLGISWFAKTCVTPVNTAVYYPGNTTKSAHCELYRQEGDNFYCTKCVFKKTGNVLIANTFKYLNCSVDIVGCEDDYYGGFHLNTKAYSKYGIDSLKEFTCHNCSNSNQVIFAYLDMSKSTGTPFNGYDLFGKDPNALKATDSIVKEGNVVSCVNVSAAGLNFKENNFNATFTDNCLFAYFDITKDKIFTTEVVKANYPIRCLECKPNYRKIVDAADEVLGCLPIENCNINFQDRWINSCASCNEGYSWKWDNTNNKILFDFCVNNQNDLGCLAYSLDFVTGTSKHCKYCKKGYLFNKDGFCEKITAPKCETGFYFKSETKFNVGNPNYNEFFLVEFLLPSGIGCTKCNSDYLPHYETLTKFLACTKSPYLESKALIPSTSLIRYCEDYLGNDENLTCVKCYDNYIPSENGQNCLPLTNFPNCEKVNNNLTECGICGLGFYLRKKKCELKLIPNCSTYDSNSDEMRCSICIEGYYTSDDKYSCILGKLSNCKVYDNNGKCTECHEKYGLISLSDNKVYCLEIKENLFCKTVNQSLLNQHQFQCLTCNPNYVITTVSTDYQKSECLKITDINNCETHNINSSLGNSTLRCDKCVNSFYVTEDGLECKQRAINIDNCLVYSDNTETCSTCQPLYYLNDKKTNCIPYPSGIFYCKEYNSATECLKCINGYFLQENLCKKLADDKLKTNCIEYEVNDTTVSCTRCDTNFIKNETGDCVKPVARNCLVYKDIKNCDTCLEGYVFSIQSEIEVTECIIYEILNCAKVDPTTKKCTLCNNGYYVNEFGKCSNVPLNILGCLYYEGKNTCSRCEKQRVLSFNKKECYLKGQNNENPMNNCQQTEYQNEQECIICKEGFYFKDNECEKCTVSLEQGCYACNYENPNQCLLCISGFHQKEEFECIKNNLDNTDNTDTKPPVISFASRLSLWIFVLIMLFK